MSQYIAPPWAAEETRLKKEYAGRIYMRPADVQFCIAQAYILAPDPSQRGYAATMGLEWPKDPIVIQEMDRLRSDPVRVARVMPTQVDLARELWALGTDDKVEVKDRLKALDQFANVQGYGTNSKGTAVSLTMVQRVMLMPAPANSEEEEEAITIEQQARLIAASDADLSRE